MKKIAAKRITEIKNKTQALVINDKVIKNLQEAISCISAYIDLADKFKGCYFWTPPTNASGRRAAEARYRLETEIDLLGQVYDLDFTSSYSCNNVYASKSLDIKEIKAILKEAQETLYVLTFDTHKALIERIDSLVETERSVNHNEELFSETYYEKRVGFGENYRGAKKVTISASGSKRLKELKDKRADLKIT